MNASESASAIARLRKEAREHEQMANEAKAAADRIERMCPDSAEYVKAIPIQTERALILFQGDAGKANSTYFRCGIEAIPRTGLKNLVIYCPTFLRRSLTIHDIGDTAGASY